MRRVWNAPEQAHLQGRVALQGHDDDVRLGNARGSPCCCAPRCPSRGTKEEPGLPGDHDGSDGHTWSGGNPCPWCGCRRASRWRSRCARPRRIRRRAGQPRSSSWCPRSSSRRLWSLYPRPCARNDGTDGRWLRCARSRSRRLRCSTGRCPYPCQPRPRRFRCAPGG